MGCSSPTAETPCGVAWTSMLLKVQDLQRAPENIFQVRIGTLLRQGQPADYGNERINPSRAWSVCLVSKEHSRPYSNHHGHYKCIVLHESKRMKRARLCKYTQAVCHQWSRLLCLVDIGKWEDVCITRCFAWGCAGRKLAVIVTHSHGWVPMIWWASSILDGSYFHFIDDWPPCVRPRIPSFALQITDASTSRHFRHSSCIGRTRWVNLCSLCMLPACKL